MSEKETTQDEYADDYRNEPPQEDYPKNPLTPAPKIEEKVDGQYFTGATTEVEPKIGDFPTAPLTDKGTKEHESSNGTDEDE